MATKVPRRETTERKQGTSVSSQLLHEQQSQGTKCKVTNSRRNNNNGRRSVESEQPQPVLAPGVSTTSDPSADTQQQQPSSSGNAAATADQDDSGSSGDEALCSALQRVTVVVLGARGVGKTSLVKQFVHGDLSCLDNVDCHKPKTGASQTAQPTCGQGQATKPNFHHVAVVVDRRLYDVRLVDCPPISRFPSSAVQEWTDYRGYGLRHAAAYIIVYDVTDDESFAYVRSMREQIVRCRASSAASTASSAGSGSSGIGASGSSRSNAAGNSSTSQFDVPIIVAANKVDLTAVCGAINGSSMGYIGHMVNGGGGGDKNGLSGAFTGRLQRDAANVVRKQWKCAYVECSARYNWRVVALFRDLMKAVDHIARQHHQLLQQHHQGSHLQSAAGSFVRVQDALHNNHCNIL